MKKLILAVAAATALGGCVAVPVSGPGAYYGPRAPSAGIYVAPPPVVFGVPYYRHHRHYR